MDAALETTYSMETVEDVTDLTDLDLEELGGPYLTSPEERQHIGAPNDTSNDTPNDTSNDNIYDDPDDIIDHFLASPTGASRLMSSPTVASVYEDYIRNGTGMGRGVSNGYRAYSSGDYSTSPMAQQAAALRRSTTIPPLRRMEANDQILKGLCGPTATKGPTTGSYIDYEEISNDYYAAGGDGLDNIDYTDHETSALTEVAASTKRIEELVESLGDAATEGASTIGVILERVEVLELAQAELASTMSDVVSRLDKLIQIVGALAGLVQLQVAARPMADETLSARQA